MPDDIRGVPPNIAPGNRPRLSGLDDRGSSAQVPVDLDELEEDGTDEIINMVNGVNDRREQDRRDQQHENNLARAIRE